MSFLKQLDFIKDEVGKIPELENQQVRPTKTVSLQWFFSRAGKAVSYVFDEKEILVFALLQWIAIALCYYLWVNILGWIPKDVWEQISKSGGGSYLLNSVFFLWSFACVGLASFPIGIFTGCMAASHLLRRTGNPSTVQECLRLVLPQAWSLWVFSWIDGWVTVEMILERLPKKNRRRLATGRFFKEILYYSWKIGTVGIIPGLIHGRGLINAGKHSIELVRKRPLELMMLRGGYSVISWIVGISAYVGTLYFFFHYPDLCKGRYNIHEMYFWAGIPILVSVLFLKIFIRPLFILCSSELYAEYIESRGVKITLPEHSSGNYSAVIGFFILVILVGTVYLFREEIGLMGILQAIQ